MFDMDLFGGKKVPRTKYQESIQNPNTGPGFTCGRGLQRVWLFPDKQTGR